MTIGNFLRFLVIFGVFPAFFGYFGQFLAIYQTLPMGSFFDEKVPFDLILI